jgi:hypothetical protein
MDFPQPDLLIMARCIYKKRPPGALRLRLPSRRLSLDLVLSDGDAVVGTLNRTSPLTLTTPNTSEQTLAIREKFRKAG